jgi:hypothetical protein
MEGIRRLTNLITFTLADTKITHNEIKNFKKMLHCDEEYSDEEYSDEEE